MVKVVIPTSYRTLIGKTVHLCFYTGVPSASVVYQLFQYQSPNGKHSNVEYCILLRSGQKDTRRMQILELCHGGVDEAKKANCFEGKLTNRDKQLCIVGFQEQHCSRLAQHQEMETMTLFDCQPKYSRQSDKLEVIL